MKKQSKIELKEKNKLVDKRELNLWKRGFTPQAEIWNGRMATIGIGIILIIIILIGKFSNI
ncbi:high light inducible protein [Prochlorococcus sp. AH-716-K03]|nr:high light inducible protein [Prochlorococcus sp. AH-716-K03]